MIRLLLIADDGHVMSSITASLTALPEVDIVGYASGRVHVGQVVHAARPDVVLVDQMRWPGMALARIAEIRAAHPQAVVVGLTDRPDADWVIDGLRAGAATVVPRDLQPGTLGLVLHDVLRGVEAQPVHSFTERSAA